MKQYIKCLVVFMLAGLGFASCVEQDMGENVTYPEKETLGNWASEYTFDDSYNYSVSLYLNEDGDTLCTFTRTNKQTGASESMHYGYCTYDPATGMTTVEFDDTFYEYPAVVYLARQRTLDRMSVQLHTLEPSGNTGGTANVKQCSFNAIPAVGFPINGAYFEPISSSGSDGVIFNQDNTCAYVLGSHEGDESTCTYTFDAASGLGSIQNSQTGETVELSVSAANRLQATIGGENFDLLQKVL